MIILGFNQCALVILLIFLISTIVRNEYGNRKNLLMQLLLWAMFISIAADNFGSRMTNYSTHTEANRVIVYIFNYIYFFTHNIILQIFMLYIYSSMDIWHIFKANKSLQIKMCLAALINVIVLIMNGWALNVFQLMSSLII